jgi:hypothetical protein
MGPQAGAPETQMNHPRTCCTVRVFGQKLHPRMPFDPTHVRLKLLHARDQWHSSRVSTPLTFFIVNYVETLKVWETLCTVRVFRQPIYTRDAIGLTMLLRLKRYHAYDQWHSSRVSTFLTRSHCKLRPNTKGLLVRTAGIAHQAHRNQI